MKVTTVSATIRYSQDTGKGAWKVIELGAEGSVDARENWQGAQAYLYAELGKQLKTMWLTNGQEPGPTTHEHWCEEHQVAFERREGKHGTFYSHRLGEGWCNESTTARR